ncbi:MAG: hypothetical protein WAX04_09715 [Oscillospiraceae bacterium]
MGINTLSKLAQDMGLNHNKKSIMMYGRYNGYSVVVTFDQSKHCYYINASVKANENFTPQSFADYAQNLKAQIKPVTIAVLQDNRISINMSMKSFAAKNMENARAVIESLTGYLSQNRYINCCGQCGTECNVNLYGINSSVHHLCDTCYNEIINSLEENKQALKAKKGNIITGIVGALLGSLLGVILWVLIAQLGYISAIGGLAIAVCAFKGYEMFGGKLNVVGVIVCCFVVLLMVYFATSLSLGLDAYNEFKIDYDVTFFDCYKLIPSLLADSSELKSAFIFDLAIGYLLSLIVVIPSAISMIKNKSGSYTVGKIDQ